jgi:hypothetical protein
MVQSCNSYAEVRSNQRKWLFTHAVVLLFIHRSHDKKVLYCLIIKENTLLHS